MQEKVQRVEVGQLEPVYPSHHSLEVPSNPGDGDLPPEDVVVLGLERDQTDIGGVALVPRPCVGQESKLDFRPGRMPLLRSRQA